mmetsp:Transcript_18627/g.36434  ORF Transcript_18627/g.36434 Transcript_18627/m.36434 type:complete len:204 (-) Transcript_18627:7234-7845(-)
MREGKLSVLPLSEKRRDVCNGDLDGFERFDGENSGFGDVVSRVVRFGGEDNFFRSRVLDQDCLSRPAANFALHIRQLYGLRGFSLKVQFVPELTSFLVDERYRTLLSTRHEGGEYELVHRSLLWRQLHQRLTQKTVPLKDNLKGKLLIQRVGNGNLNSCSFANKGLNIQTAFRQRRFSVHFHCNPRKSVVRSHKRYGTVEGAT